MVSQAPSTICSLTFYFDPLASIPVCFTFFFAPIRPDGLTPCLGLLHPRALHRQQGPHPTRVIVGHGVGGSDPIAFRGELSDNMGFFKLFVFSEYI